VSTWAILFYVVVLALATGLARTDSTRQRETLGIVIQLSAVWGLLFSGYMAIIAFFVLHTVCLMCSALYLINVGLFGAAWWLRTGLRTMGRRQALERAGQNRLVLLGSVGAVVALIVIGSWEALGRGRQLPTAADIERQRPQFYRWFFAQPVVHVPLDASPSRGDPAAPVTIVEFSDFECTHCAAFHQSLDDVLRRGEQNVRVVFRNFPLDSACNPHVASRLHPQACLAAIASQCAAEQGKFWQYHNILFDNQLHLGREYLISYATRLGLDAGRFTACLTSESVQAQVERDTKAGAALGIDSTPTWFINGRKITGALEPEQLTDALTLARVAH
jgi:protein-disulfide isomerase